MAKVHIVRQGEVLASIAARFGFTSGASLWEHPGNAELRNKRANPNVLFPGDQLLIPDKENKSVACPTGQRTRFERRGTSLVLRLILEDAYSAPIAHARCELTVDGATQLLVSDQTGRIEAKLPVHAESALLTIQPPGALLPEPPIAIRLGHLDPVTEVSGQIARLNNLGYFAGHPEENDDESLESAIEEFQCDHMAGSVDGKCGPRTQAKLLEVHGC
jgi:N-acetylmuramoyl-L-alanine amidase